MTPEQAEADRDSQGFSDKQLEPFLQEAMDELIYRLFDGKQVGLLHLDAYVEKYAEEIAAMLIANEVGRIPLKLEELIRRDLENGYELYDVAAELAQGER